MPADKQHLTPRYLNMRRFQFWSGAVITVLLYAAYVVGWLHNFTDDRNGSTPILYSKLQFFGIAAVLNTVYTIFIGFRLKKFSKEVKAHLRDQD